MNAVSPRHGSALDVATRNTRMIIPVRALTPEEAIGAEILRRARLVQQAAPERDRSVRQQEAGSLETLADELVCAADKFVIRPGSRQDAMRFLEGFGPHLDEACIGSISEIFDAEPPFHPRGCVAQAWGVAEVLRVLAKTLPDWPAPRRR
jgi:glycogen debranching enzyme